MKDGAREELTVYDANRTSTVLQTSTNSVHLRFCYSTSYNPESPGRWTIKYKAIGMYANYILIHIGFDSFVCIQIHMKITETYV